MKITAHIPTEQYGFVEADFEVADDAEAGDVKEVYDRIAIQFRPQEGLTPKEFNAFLDRYVTDNTGDLETYNAMSEPQKAVIQELKKCFKRLKPKKD